MPKTPLAPLRNYGLALVAVGAAIVARLALAPILGDRFPFLTCYVAIVATAWYGGFGPALLAVCLSWAAIDRWVLIPDRQPAFFHGSRLLFGLAFFTVGLTIAALGEAVRAARRRSHASAGKAEQAQRAAETEREWFRLAVDSIADAVLTTDAGGLVVSMNPAAVLLTGWSEIDAAGQPWDKVVRLVDDDASPARFGASSAASDTGEAPPLLLTARDGASRAVECRRTPLKNGPGMVVVCRDVTERRRADEASRNLGAIVESSEDAILSIGEDQCIRSWNAAAERLFGYTAAEAIGRSIAILSPDTPDPESEIAGLPPTDALTGRFEALRRRRTGDLIEVSECRSPILDAAGRRTGTAIVIRDVTRQKQAEASLQAGRERLRLALEAGRMGVWDWDLVTGEFTWSTELEPLPNIQPSTLKEFEEVVHPDDRGLVSDALTRTLEGGAYDVEFRMMLPATGLHWIASKGQLRKDESGRPVRLIGVGIDITARKLAEERLKETEQRFSRFMQHLPGLAWIKDLDGRYIYANEATLRAFNRERNALYGKRDDEVFDPATARQYRDNDLRALASETGIKTVESLKQEIDGLVHHSVVSKFPVLGSDGRIALIGGIAIDITDRMAMEESLRESDRRKDEFIATLAHELRNPLAPIQNALQLLGLPSDRGVDLEAERAMAERQVRHLARLVDDLLDVSRINKGQIELRREPVELDVVVGRAADSIRSLLQDRGHRLQISLPDERLLLHADPTRLEQILGNLLNNAVKYTDPGGRIELEAERDGETLLLRVRDNGIGIEPEMIPRIFEMFIQAGRPTDRAQGGLGIGLGLVRKLVELHGGSISVQSDGPGTGSEFQIRLPLLDQASLVPPPQKPTEPLTVPAKPARRRVLVVDDNHDAATSLARVLSRLYDQEVRVAHDGFSALEAAEDFRPALILLDIGLPGLDGHEVTRRLRARPNFQHTRIVALTGWGQDADVERSRQAGFDQHLVKPAHPDAILALLAADPTPSFANAGGASLPAISE